MEDPVDAVFVVGGGEDVGDDQFAASGDDHGFVPKIGVFEEDTGIFFVDADGVFDGGAFSGTVDECGVLVGILLGMVVHNHDKMGKTIPCNELHPCSHSQGRDCWSYILLHIHQDRKRVCVDEDVQGYRKERPSPREKACRRLVAHYPYHCK